jgi:hypothetical protein
MTANRNAVTSNATAAILCDQDEFGKTIGETIGKESWQGQLE